MSLTEAAAKAGIAIINLTIAATLYDTNAINISSDTIPVTSTSLVKYAKVKSRTSVKLGLVFPQPPPPSDHFLYIAYSILKICV